MTDTIKSTSKTWASQFRFMHVCLCNAHVQSSTVLHQTSCTFSSKSVKVYLMADSHASLCRGASAPCHSSASGHVVSDCPAVHYCPRDRKGIIYADRTRAQGAHTQCEPPTFLSLAPTLAPGVCSGSLSTNQRSGWGLGANQRPGPSVTSFLSLNWTATALYFFLL